MARCNGKCACGDGCGNTKRHSICSCLEDSCTENARRAIAQAPTFMFYAIASEKTLNRAQWYRTYSKNKSCGFVDDLDNATFWTKKSLAQKKCTVLGGSTVLVGLCVGAMSVIDQTEHRKNVAEKKRRKEELLAKARIEANAAFRLERARLALEVAQKEFDKLNKPPVNAAQISCLQCGHAVHHPYPCLHDSWHGYPCSCTC